MKRTLEEALGLRMAAARHGAELSQTQLAAKVDITVSMISMVERGDRLPTTRLQLRWAQACGVSMAELHKGLEELMGLSETPVTTTPKRRKRETTR